MVKPAYYTVFVQFLHNKTKVGSMKKILGTMRKICDEFNLIEDGDKIAIGLSGGKDSMLLLYAMGLYKQYIRKNFTFISITVDVGFDGFDAAGIEAFAKGLGVEHHTVHTEIAQVVFTIREEKNPCALCSKMRKGALYKKAAELGCNKVAFAHNVEDLLETLLLSLLYEGKISTFAPYSYLTRTNLTLIRPFGYLPEKDIIGAVCKLDIPIYKNPCPVDGHTKRVQARAIMDGFIKINPDAKKSMLSALRSAGKYGIWDLPAGVQHIAEQVRDKPAAKEQP